MKRLLSLSSLCLALAALVIAGCGSSSKKDSGSSASSDTTAAKTSTGSAAKPAAPSRAGPGPPWRSRSRTSRSSPTT